MPAWWPCSFFEEQQAVYSSEYELYNLYGTCTWLSHKEQFRQLLSFHSLHNVEVQMEKKSLKIKIQCAKFRSIKKTARAITTVSEEVGRHILKATNGILPSFIYIQSRSEVAIFIAEWAKRNNIRIILAEHILYIRHEINYISRRVENMFAIADQIFCVSNYLYRNLLTSGLIFGKVRVIGNLINDYAVPINWNELSKNGRIMFVAGHVHDKDIATLFAVAEKLQSKSIFIDIFGLEGTESFCGKCLSDIAGTNVSFMGKKSHSELLQQYSSYTLLVSTSISETFGLSVAEAIAHGTPVVCTDSGGIRDFVNNQNGYVVGIKDLDDLQTHILKALEKPWDYQRMSIDILSKYGKTAYQAHSLV